MTCQKCRRAVIALHGDTMTCVRCQPPIFKEPMMQPPAESESMRDSSDSLSELNAVNLNPAQFEQEAILLSQQLAELEREYNPMTDDVVVESFIKSFGPLFSIAVLKKITDHYVDIADDIHRNKLVGLMKTINAQKWTMKSGMMVELKKKYSVSLTDCDKNLLTGWLESRQLGYLIKDNLAFEKGQVTPQLVAELRERGLHFDRESGVNTASLKSVIISRDESGDDLPPDAACKMSIYELAEVKQPKNKK